MIVTARTTGDPPGVRWCYSKWYSYNFCMICRRGRLKNGSICTWPANGLPDCPLPWRVCETAERQPEESAPNHSTLCRFRSRLGLEKFQRIFNEIILVSDQLQIIDAIQSPVTEAFLNGLNYGKRSECHDSADSQVVHFFANLHIPVAF